MQNTEGLLRTPQPTGPPGSSFMGPGLCGDLRSAPELGPLGAHEMSNQENISALQPRRTRALVRSFTGAPSTLGTAGTPVLFTAIFTEISLSREC